MIGQTDASPEASESSRRPPDWLSGAAEKGLRAVLAALNHLLAADPRARASLRPHASRLIRIQVADPEQAAALFGALFSIDSEGLLKPAPPDADSGAVSVTMTVRPSVDAAFALLTAGPAGLQAHLRIEGDVLLAAALGDLSRSMRWDVEEDLSRLTGDVIAHRVAGAASAALDAFRAFGQQLGTSFARQWSVENPVLVTRNELADHSTALSSLESRLAALERRSKAVRR
ncbi:MAG: SCP2 domain-containing protein [Betaproteobacteria bacterium]